jgi:serine/threonine-protein kinase
LKLQEVSPGNNLVLKDKGSKREFIINHTTKLFIEKFSEPKCFDEISDEIANEVNAPGIEIKKLIKPFFRYMKYRQFIVPENASEVKAKRRQLFNANKIVDNYKIIKNIDANDDVELYHATDLKSESDAVIKLLRQATKQEVKELLREFRFLTHISKTGVTPKAYKFITGKEYVCFAQEYIDGKRLMEHVRTKKRSSFNDIAEIILGIITGFKKIHARGVVHGDIHPSNIIVTRNGKIKIIDFGFAVNYEVEKNEIVNFGGVYFYMPPERINTTTYKKFSRRPDFYSDVYQLGMILYDLLYHKYPFNGITWEELSKEIKEKEAVYPAKSYYKFTVPEWLINIIQKCLEKNPAKRFINAQEMHSSFIKSKVQNGIKIRPAIKI